MKPNPITRRSFLKTSAFTAGSYVILSRGIALANPGSGNTSNTKTCSRKWVTRIAVEFTSWVPHNPTTIDSGKDDWSGVIWLGTLRYWYRECSAGTQSVEKGPVTADVRSGGYIYRENGVVQSQLKQGSETSWPPGNFRISTTNTSIGKATEGFNEFDDAKIEDPSDPQNKYRTAMKIHLIARASGSSGCIVFTNQNAFRGFVSIMDATRRSCPQGGSCPVLNSVPLKVWYNEDLTNLPTYTWDRHKMGNPIPQTDPTTTPPNP